MKVKFSSLVWKMRENFSVSITDCKAISPIHSIFHRHWSPKNNPNQHCSTKPGPTTTNLAACWLGTLPTEWVIACMQQFKKLQNSVEAHQTLKQPHPLEFNQATPKCIPDDSPVSVQQHDTQLDTNPLQFQGDTELWKIGITPGTQIEQIHSPAESMLFRTTPPPGI